MPELPEVEVVKKSLNKKILNLSIKRVEIFDGNLRYKINKNDTIKLVGKKIKRIHRRSKFLIFDIGKNIFMMVHLGMTGKFFFVDKDQKKIKTSFYYSLNKKKDRAHDRLIFYLQNNQKKLESTVSCILHVCFQVSFGMATGLVSVVLNVQQLIKLCLGD